MTNEPPATETSAAFDHVWVAALFALCLLALLGIWWPAYTPGQDTPHHLFFARVLSEPELFSAHFDVVPAPTAQGFVYLASLFEPLGLVTAGKLVRTLGLLLTLLAFWSLSRAAGTRRSPGMLIGVATVASFYHAMGFENFALAMPLGLLAVGLGVSAARTGDARSWLVVALVLAATSVGHAVVAGMVMLELLIVVIAIGPAGQRAKRLVQLTVVSAPAAAHAAWSVWLSASSQAERGITAGLGTQRLPLREQLENVVDTSFGGYSALGAQLLAVAILIALSEGLFQRRSERRRLVVATLLVWAGIYAAAPFHAAGWAYAQPRVLMMLVFVPVGLLRWGRVRWIELTVTTIASAAFLLTSAINQNTAGQAVAAQIERFGSGPIDEAMSVTIDPGGYTTSRYAHALPGTPLYAAARGGAVPQVHAANPAIHAVIARRLPGEWPPHPPIFIYRSLDCDFNPDCEDAALELAQRIAVQGLRFDTVLLIGGPEAFRESLVARGYERVAPDRFVPRPGALLLEVGPVHDIRRRDLAVRVGYPDDFGWFTGGVLSDDALGQPPPIELGPLPAGPIEIDCRWVRDPADLEALDDAPPACRGQAEVVAGQRTTVVIELIP